MTDESLIGCGAKALILSSYYIPIPSMFKWCLLVIYFKVKILIQLFKLLMDNQNKSLHYIHSERQA